MLRYVVPALFVLIWSTGFIVARAAMPHADLQLFLVVRLTVVALIMAGLARLAHAVWPDGRGIRQQLLAGVLLQGMYLSFSYWAIARGLPAGIMALLGALQPLFTALFFAATGRPLGPRAWTGLLIGFAGVACVLEPKIAAAASDAFSVLTIGAALVSVTGVTAGSLVQKSLGACDLRVAVCLQNIAGAAVALTMAGIGGDWHWDGAVALWAALTWSVVIASVVGVTLLMWMLRRGDATKVTSLILLVPPLAALQALLFFDERLIPVQLLGFALALGGVLLTQSAPAAARPRDQRG